MDSARLDGLPLPWLWLKYQNSAPLWSNQLLSARGWSDPTVVVQHMYGMWYGCQFIMNSVEEKMRIVSSQLCNNN